MDGGLPPAPVPPTASYAEVALVPALPGKDLLTYRVEEAERARIRPGMRVMVPLGRRRETGLVVSLGDVPPPGLTSIRAVTEVLDAEPIFTPELVGFCRWASDYYVTTLAEVLAAALPGGMRASSARLVRLADAAEVAAARPPSEAARRSPERAILAYLRANGATTARQLTRVIRHPAVARAIRTLAARGTVIVEEQLRAPAAKARLLTVFTLTRELAPEEVAALGRRAPRQRGVYDRLLAAAERRLDAGVLVPAERAAAEALARRGVAARLRAERYRDVRPPAGPDRPPPALTAEQQVAVDAVAGTEGFQVFLLHGVTGSGKTEVYLQLAARARAAGRSVLMLVPEIALTHQLVLRVQERFGSGVALLHSGLGPGERWDEWRRIARGEAHVVVGTRSAVFAPLATLGLVIVDEEHDAAYKQDEGLRYNARDLALVRAKLAGARAILGSATPAVESYHQALDGKFRLLSLTRRVEGRALPEIELIDLRRPTPGMPGRAPATFAPPPVAATLLPRPTSMLFSPRLLEAMRATLERREQVLLFLNRRGFATSLQCLACGEPAGCPSCSVSLTMHERRGVLLCHHCGYARPSGAPCTACHGIELRACGEGTERIEAEVARLFPASRIGRLDRDTTARRGAHRHILDAWSAGTLDVLIGTQMVAKGHDVPGVTLVGVLLADVALNMPDFRAAERAFQLLTQVAGRAGRGDGPGRVLVQTYRPEHHSLRAAAVYDYQGFAARELALRRELGYPPFTRLAVLRLEGTDVGATERAATELASRGRAAAGGTVIVRGPAAAPLERLRGRYRWQILLSSASARALRDLLRRLLDAWRSGSTARTIRLVVDMDPVSML